MSAKRKAVGEIGEGRKRRNVEAGRECLEYSEKYNDPKADVELISSDNVVFKVHGYHLMASSIFFRDLLTEDTVIEQGVIPVTDDKLESADALLNFLDCITGKEMWDLLADVAKARRVITLLFEYDCPTVLMSMRWQVRLLAASDSKAHNPYKMWKLCLALDDPIGVRDLIPKAAQKVWRDEHHQLAERDAATASQAVLNTSALDPTGMSINTLSALPPKYLLAFLRGYAKRGDPGESITGGDLKAVAEEFYRVYTR